jgi:ribosome-binding protein aMBF1 (putative translation factor)
MIKNDRQYRITKAAAVKFAEALKQFETAAEDPHVDPIVRRAEREALKSQLDDLRAQIRAYEELASGSVGVLELGSLADLPHALVRARIASGMSHKDLGEKLGLKEQQVQRYEATDYQQASLSRLLEVAQALNVNVREDVLLPASNRSAGGVFSRLKELGLSKDFVLSRLVPRELSASLTAGQNGAVDQVLFAATSAIAHIFGWTPAAVLGEGRPWLDGGVLGAARFKVSETAERKSLEVYTFYAHFLALLLLQATEELPQHSIPTDPDALHKEVIDRYGVMTFRSALLYCWDLGVPVLPLGDSGAFHGACWRANGRNVIVLKQRTQSLARWLFDLLHELRHAAEDPISPTHAVIEEAETSPARLNSEEEKEAYWFAGEATLGGRAEELIDECVRRANGSIPRLKAVVPEVARTTGVDTAALANYMAFRLSLQGENWWGTAMNLQPKDESPWEVARDVLLQRANLARLTGIDRELFVQALRNSQA